MVKQCSTFVKFGVQGSKSVKHSPNFGPRHRRDDRGCQPQRVQLDAPTGQHPQATHHTRPHSTEAGGEIPPSAHPARRSHGAGPPSPTARDHIRQGAGEIPPSTRPARHSHGAGPPRPPPEGGARSPSPTAPRGPKHGTFSKFGVQGYKSLKHSSNLGSQGPKV